MRIRTILGAAGLALLLALTAEAQSSSGGGQTNGSENGQQNRIKQSRTIRPKHQTNNRLHHLGQTTTRGRTTNVRSNALEKDNSDIGQYDLPQTRKSNAVAKDNSNLPQDRSMGTRESSATPEPITLRGMRRPVNARNTGAGNYRTAGIVAIRTHRAHRAKVTHHRTTRHHRRRTHHIAQSSRGNR
jgi:hypothetical protein